MSLQNWASNGPFANLPVRRRMIAKHWSGIKNCQGKSEVVGLPPIPMTRVLPRGTIRELRDQKPTLILTI